MGLRWTLREEGVDVFFLALADCEVWEQPEPQKTVGAAGLALKMGFGLIGASAIRCVSPGTCAKRCTKKEIRGGKLL